MILRCTEKSRRIDGAHGNWIPGAITAVLVTINGFTHPLKCSGLVSVERLIRVARILEQVDFSLK